VTLGLDGHERARIELRSSIRAPEGFSLYPRPRGRDLAADAGFGQDGSTLWWHDGGEVPTRLSRTDRIVSDVSPSGNEIVTTPHDDGGIEIFAWGQQEPTAVLAAHEVFAREDEAWSDDDQDGFDYYAWVLDDDRLLVKTRQGRLLAIDRATVQPAYELVLDDFPIGEVYEGINEIAQISVLDPQRLLVSHRNGSHHLYRLSTSDVTRCARP
jgi:hypothetical protein